MIQCSLEVGLSGNFGGPSTGIQLVACAVAELLPVLPRDAQDDISGNSEDSYEAQSVPFHACGARWIRINSCLNFGPLFFRIVHDVQTRQTIDVLGLDTGTLQLGQILALSIAEPCSQPRGNAVPFQALPPWLQGQIWMEQGARMCSSCHVAILAPKTCFFGFVCLYHLSLFFSIFHISSFTFFGTLLCLFLLLFSRFRLYRRSSLSVCTTLYCPAHV